jgi:membrane protease subunit (stomatin/prohibitin family)
VLFVNTKEFTIKWGTKNAISIPAPQLNLPGGMPIRAFGTFSCKVSDYQALIDKVAGVKQQYTVEDIKERVLSVLDQLLMKWISKEGKDMFNLQANAYDISKGIREDLDMEITKIGITITEFNISSFTYPEEVQKMQTKAASQSMVGDMNRYQQVSMVDAMASGHGTGANTAGNMAANMAGMQMGMMMGQQMANQMANGMNNNSANTMNTGNTVNTSNGQAPKFCPNCGTATNGANFCGNCGQKLV